MSNKYQTHVTFRNKAAGNRMAAAYRKQMGLGLDGLPRRYGRQKKQTGGGGAEQAGAGNATTRSGPVSPSGGHERQATEDVQ